MWKNAYAWFGRHKRIILITFEIFWILVFLIDRVSSTNPSEIPQFVYVNF